MARNEKNTPSPTPEKARRELTVHYFKPVPDSNTGPLRERVSLHLQAVNGVELITRRVQTWAGKDTITAETADNPFDILHRYQTEIEPWRQLPDQTRMAMVRIAESISTGKKPEDLSLTDQQILPQMSAYATILEQFKRVREMDEHADEYTRHFQDNLKGTGI